MHGFTYDMFWARIFNFKNSWFYADLRSIKLDNLPKGEDHHAVVVDDCVDPTKENLRIMADEVISKLMLKRYHLRSHFKKSGACKCSLKERLRS